MKKNKILSIRRIMVIVFLIFFGLIAFINYRGNYLEFKELGENYLNTFLIKQKFQYMVMIINFVLIFLFMYFSGRKIKKGLKTFFEQEKKEIPRLPNKSIALIVSIIESIFIKNIFTPNIILLFSNTSFGETDPIFNLDISFFMYIEPLIKMVIMYIMILFIALIVYAFIYYVIVFNKYFDGIDKETLKNSPLMKTIFRNLKVITLCIALYIGVCSMDIVFDNFLKTDNNIKLAGAGIIDKTIKFWGYIILAIILLFSVNKAIRSFKKGYQTKILKDLAIVPIYLVSLFIVMVGFDFIFVRPNEFDKERLNIENNISATKKAYGIDCNLESINYSGTITPDETENNQNIINNAVIVDKQISVDYLEENQKGTGYYTYPVAKLSKYKIDDENKLVYVSPREIVNNKRTYNSKTYEYTHGYGLIFTSATNYSENGEIEYIQNDISGADEKIKIKTPQIYYGLNTDTTVVTNVKDKKEFDYADNDIEYETSYSGSAGLNLNFIDRVVLGLKEKDIKIAFSGAVNKESKVLINRNILKRAKKALPDIIYDNEPYPVVDNNGDIYWVIDAYTVSSSYPCSTYTEIQYDNQKRGINYIRNSIKVIINAYTGEMKYYITDRTDPMAMAYRKVYPELFEDLDSQISESIKAQFIYPKFLYDVQATMLEEYHNTKADVLYRSDDTWQKATYKNVQTNSKVASSFNSYYTTVKDDKVGLIQIYTPKDKQSITSYLVGTVENGENKLKIKNFHSDTIILGPTQLDVLISQDETIKAELDALSVTGAKITKNMIILPIENTLIYVEPIYQTLINESKLPVLKKVIVASGNKVAIGDNLKQALQNLISAQPQYSASIEIETTEDLYETIDTLIKANDNLSESLKSNDWELMGSDIKKLQELIGILEKQVKKEKEKKNNTIDNSTENNTLNETNNLTTVNNTTTNNNINNNENNTIE